MCRSQCYSDVITELMAPFHISAVSRMCFHGNMNNPILLKFGTKVYPSIFNKITNVC